ncbi:flagellar filament capping protein FliD [Endozoicomonas sp. 4G]|uniref:flagellar filament capping protein FliD n=1 Tax=Endozoicomonas sp. 4G TaxID=2872754 RepID=UPI002078EE13|nr:flagellar filament capping protein FliD [Endozoicomonas sp. 4G]
MFSLNGIYSGLDVTAMVDALVEAERAPAESRYARREQAYNVELSAVGQLQSALDELNTQLTSLNSVSKLSPREGSSSHESVLSATVSSSAVAGNYQFYVDQLATHHQAVSNAVASDATIGAGTVSLSVNGQSFSVVVEPGKESLADLRDAINSATDNSGVQATIINENGQQRLMLNSEESGAANAITADFSGLSGGSAALGSLTDLQVAADAIVRFGSGAAAITVTSSDNQLENLIDGVTLDLKAVSSDPVTVNVSLDKDNVKESMQGFVDAWNELQSTLDTLTDYNGATAGPLNGDAQTRTIANQLRSVLSSLFGEDGDPFRTIGQLGLKTTEDGSLTLDTETLDEALANNFDEVAQVLAGEDGLMSRLEEVLATHLGSDGTLETREDRIEEGLSDIEDDRAGLELRLERIRSYHQRQFLMMETILASFSGTSEWLTNSLQNNNS